MHSHITLLQQEGDASSDLCKHLDITHFPTVCFFKNKVLVWKTYGAAALTSDTNEGLLYFSENSQLKSSDHVRELDTEQGYDSFMASEGIEKPADVKIVMFSTPMCTPCIHVYPSFVTLAMNFKGIADFARVDMEDSATERQPLFERLRILEVPTFVLFFRGKEISRTVSSQRGDLIGHVLQTVMKLGITPPAPKRN
jgi:thiol-disulfide isomerase/thioredoxin